jgi:uncharacterized protein (TIGR02757 family)
LLKVCLPLEFDRGVLETLYERYNRREYIHPDPLEFLYRYESIADREIVGIVAASLAYGRVNQILKSVSLVLDRMGPSPFQYIQKNSLENFQRSFKDFKHRFTTGDQLSGFLKGIKGIVELYGSLQSCFLSGLRESDSTVLPALTAFVKELNACADCNMSMFLPSPGKGSACKRLNLFLRWMVRCDDVDPGGWRGVSPSRLIVPLDTHMHRIGRMLGLISRKQADMRAALELTDKFKTIFPSDPVRYDFALTRLGIRNDLSLALAVSGSHD